MSVIANRPIKHGSTDVSVTIRILDSTDGTPETGVVAATSGLALSYRRTLAAAVSLTAASDLAALTTAHADGGMKHIGAGYYRIDVQDAAFAAGVNEVLIYGTITDMVVVGCIVPLVPFDPYVDVLGTPAGASIAADIASLQTDTTATLAALDSTLDANVKQVNDVTITGNGSSQPFGV